MRMNEKKILPLKLWILIGGIVFASALVLTQDWQIGSNDKQKNETLNVSRLQKKTNNPRIILLGNSLLALGLPTETIIEKKLKKESISFKIDRFVVGGRRPEYFISIFPQILQSKSKIIIIQADSFFLSKEDFFDLDRSRLILKKNILSVYSIVTKGSVNSIDNESNYIINSGKSNYSNLISGCLRVFRNKTQNDDNALKELSNLKIGINNKIKSYLPFIKEAQKSGTKVVFLEIGRSKSVNDYLGEDAQKAINESLTTLGMITNSEIWRFPVTLPEDHYCDRYHLNEKGQKIFTEWLIDRLKQNAK
jgi:hypothetical protein